jgi:hypothetical protein
MKIGAIGQGELVLTVQGFVADPFGRRVRRRYKAALRGSPWGRIMRSSRRCAAAQMRSCRTVRDR